MSSSPSWLEPAPLASGGWRRDGASARLPDRGAAPRSRSSGVESVEQHGESDIVRDYTTLHP